MLKVLRPITILTCLLIPTLAVCQGFSYFHKIENLASNTRNASDLYHRLDSLKQTPSLNHNQIEKLFDRDIDFGYKQHRIILELNSFYYQLDLLTKNDLIYLSAVKFYNLDNTDQAIFPKLETFKIDTINSLKYLRLRNNYYHSSKMLSDLKKEIGLREEYVLYSGDGFNKTNHYKHLDSLVNKKNINELTIMLKSINCEIQTYGVTGFEMLSRKKIKISGDNRKLIKHIKERNSELVSYSGDIGPGIRKEY